MNTVLWISRHKMTDTQFADLERVMGGPVQLILWTETVRSAEELLGAIANADAVAAVLPTELLAALLPILGGKRLLQAVSRRESTGRTVVLPDGSTEQEFVFSHLFWQQIIRIEIETHRL